MPELKVLSALNTRYLIVGGDVPPVVNRNAYGNAWFVNGFVDAATPDDEIGLIASTDLRTTAIIGADFKDAVKMPGPAGHDAAEAGDGDFIKMTYYSPNELHYHYKASSDRPVVFSEIYYPKGWHASVDGNDVGLFRADWIFRGAVLPAGEHDIVMRFDPKVYPVSESVSKASSITLLLMIAAAIAGAIVFANKEKKEEEI